MVNQLSGLVSGNRKRPLIINGKLVTQQGRILLARRDRYKVVIILPDQDGSEKILENGEGILNKMATSFNEKYLPFAGSMSNQLANFYANLDPFTGAVVMRNALYDKLIDATGEFHIHSSA